MKFSFCPNCGKTTSHQRKLGFGTLFAVIFTLGWWLLAIPFYPKRCTICGSEDFGAPPGPQGQRSRLSLQQILSMQTKICPKCGESIKFSAQKCRFCGHEFDPDQVKQAVDRRLDAISRGAVACPHCGEFGIVEKTRLPDGSFGPWCPYCQKPATVQK